jgi:hypothetical protein
LTFPIIEKFPADFQSNGKKISFRLVPPPLLTREHVLDAQAERFRRQARAGDGRAASRSEQCTNSRILLLLRPIFLGQKPLQLA